MKESYYFPHDCNASQDPKIMMLLSSCGLSGVGAYWIIIEILHQQESGMISYQAFKDYLKFYYHFDNNRGSDMLAEIEQVLIKSELLLIKNELVYSERVLNNKKYRKNLSEIRSLAGKKSGESRANRTSVQQKGTKAQQGKERKGEEIKENNIYSAVDVLELVDEVLKILKIEATPENNFRELIQGQINHYTKTDPIAVAYKLAPKTASLSNEEKYFKFTNWLGRELTDEQKQDLNPHSQWKKSQSEPSSEQLPDPLTMPID